ncbi:unnamed protein product [Gadus morhua 'NCC']
MVEKNCLRAPLAGAAGRRQSRPAAVQQLWRCTPGAELAPKLGGSSSGLAAPADEQLRRTSSSGWGSSAAVRQLTSGSTIPFYSMCLLLPTSLRWQLRRGVVNHRLNLS